MFSFYEELEAKFKEGGKKVMFLRCIYIWATCYVKN